MFLGNPGTARPRKAGHLTYPLSKRLSRRLLCPMLLNGTFETYRDVRFLVAIRGKTDVARTTHSGSEGPEADIGLARAGAASKRLNGPTACQMTVISAHPPAMFCLARM